MSVWAILALCASCLLAGCALGYYTAHSDIERQARDRTTQ